MSTRDNNPGQLRALAVQGPTFALSKTCLGRHPPVEGSLVQSKAVLRGIVRNPLREDDRVTPLVLRTAWLTCGRLPDVLQHADSACGLQGRAEETAAACQMTAVST